MGKPDESITVPFSEAFTCALALKTSQNRAAASSAAAGPMDFSRDLIVHSPFWLSGDRLYTHSVPWEPLFSAASGHVLARFPWGKPSFFVVCAAAMLVAQIYDCISETTDLVMMSLTWTVSSPKRFAFRPVKIGNVF